MIERSLSAPAERLKSGWLTSEDVCQILRVCDKTLANYLRDGKLHASKIGRRNYFKLSEIEKLLEDNYNSPLKEKLGIYGS